MLRLQNIKNLPLRLEVMVQDCYYQLKPSKQLKISKESSPLKLFIQKLIFDPTFVSDEEKLSKILRKLPWSEKKCVKWLKYAILDLNLNASFERLDRSALLLRSIAKYRPSFVMDCIDTLLEEIQIGMERNDYRDSPSRIRQMKLLAELYNFRLIDATVIFDILYHLIGFGSSSCYQAGNIRTAHHLLNENRKRLLTVPPSSTSSSIPPSKVDPPAVRTLPSSPPSSSSAVVAASPSLSGIYLTHFAAAEDSPGEYFHIILICILMDTCGHYFCKGHPRLKLDRFLTFFQRYFLAKESLPMHVKYIIKDSLEILRPQLHWFQNLHEATHRVMEMMEEEAEILKDVMDDPDEASSNEEEEEGSSLFESSTEEESLLEEEHSHFEEDVQNSPPLVENEYKRDILTDFIVDDAFDKELQQLVMDSLSSVRSIGRGVTDLHVPSVKSFLKNELENEAEKERGDSLLPSTISSSTILPPQNPSESPLESLKNTKVCVEKDKTAFYLLTRKAEKRNKFDFKRLEIPSESPFQQKLLISVAQKQQMEEKEEIKRFVMDSVNRSHQQEDQRRNYFAHIYARKHPPKRKKLPGEGGEM
ncbi:MIF4G domain-containing protein [Cardiosporidium cionae]|uniref:MIF4G domain-containing protein n=1 Tax=Cardiosporidium cionae TaxID=476202 RepID=A0ABQ7J8A4_9APIC|nr:MIF4G domain-containing protein [Cardiosporidium cionae]|eukprot:KAF8820217.1 MIF4G domain-containing protein [Cardiosporidium cionae]